MRLCLRLCVLASGIISLGLWTWMLNVLSSPYTEHNETPKNPFISHDKFLHVQQLRKKKLRNFCLQNAELSSLQARRNAEQLLSKLEVNHNLQTVYCKAGGTDVGIWEQLLKVINRSEITVEAPIVNPSPVSPSNQLSNYNVFTLETILRSYTKILFVREPLERLVSAYIQSFAGNIPFSQFIDDFLSLKPENTDDFHKTVVDVCHPCFIRYDYIVMYGFLRAEIQHLIKRMSLPETVLVQEFTDTQTKQAHKWLMKNLLKELNVQQLKQLVKAYSWDYGAFTFYRSLL
ncbi:carbohydrate sulfotransferase 14 [Bombina bombina]|uniref:carbohydrate sulfotransferase 14 n=1 Tax=Bombina bombina TaxID=8345 RepID=UPI00235A472F|nr:carbohydrate sulfotransferase 14 [Bombina bombina]